MEISALWDTNGAVIVLGGTLLATFLACGRREMTAAWQSLTALLAPRFDFEKARAEIARDVEAIRRDGVLRAHPLHTSDREIALVSDALIHDRSLRSLLATHEKCQRQRQSSRLAALAPIRQAAEMAPVFGMAGTLFSLSQMQVSAMGDVQLLASVAMAIVTTLYGLLLANLAFHPLARLLERRMLAEEEDRRRLIDWLAAQLEQSCPPKRKSLERAG